MGQRIHFAMQSYRKDSCNNVVTSRWRPCDTADEAIRLAARVVESGKAVGAVALSERTSGDFEGNSQPLTIAAFGDVPEEMGDFIPF